MTLLPGPTAGVEGPAVRCAAERRGRPPRGAVARARVGHVLLAGMAGHHEAIVGALDHIRGPAARRGDRARVLPCPAVRGEVGDPVAGTARGPAGPDQGEAGAVERHAADRILGAVVDGDRHRRPVGAAVGAQPGAGSAVRDHRGGPVRGGEVDGLRGRAGRQQPELRRRQSLPAQAVTGDPDHGLVTGAGRLVAGGQEPVRCACHHADHVAGLARGDPAGGRQRPGLPVRAGPDGIVAERHPAARAAGDPHGLVAQRGLAAARQLNRGQTPGAPGIGRNEELLADRVTGSQRARRHHRVPRRDDALDRVEDAPRQLSRVGRHRVRRDRVRRAGAALIRGGAWPGHVPPQHGENHRHGHGRGGQGRHADGRAPPAEPAPPAPGPPAAGTHSAWRARGRCGLEQQRAGRGAGGAGRPGPAGGRSGLLPGPRQDRLGRRVICARGLRRDAGQPVEQLAGGGPLVRVLDQGGGDEREQGLGNGGDIGLAVQDPVQDGVGVARAER